MERIIDSLSRAIAQHMLPPGTRLVEAQIVDSLDANRNHVQAALQRLALQRIVTIEPNRGAHVSQPTAQEAREIFVARRAIERAVIESITPQRMSQFAADVEAHMCVEHRATHANDRRAIVRELSEFHRLLSHIGGNRVLADILDNLMVRSALIVALYQRNDEPTCQHDEHRSILLALQADNGSLAVELMENHLNHLERELAINEEGDKTIDIRSVLATI
ncbi:GntR family transcriptional regulator [Halomonas sp. LS-001]